MPSIQQLFRQFEQAVSNHNWADCADLLFRLLYAMPAATQTNLAILMIRRYLPIFKAKWPDIEWPEHILNEPQQWLDEFDRSVPDNPDEENPSLSAFVFCFDALVYAFAQQTDHTRLTSSCGTAIVSAINARVSNVWIADDPEAVQVWMTQKYLPSRSALENVASIAVSKREWQVVLEWLAVEQQKNPPVPMNPEDIEHGLAQWQAHERLLIIPHS
jgi:hypothetical protein